MGAADPLAVGDLVLQWGRGGEAAESHAVDDADAQGQPSFNGAAAVRPRKAGRSKLRLSPSYGASMGPRR